MLSFLFKKTGLSHPEFKKFWVNQNVLSTLKCVSTLVLQGTGQNCTNTNLHKGIKLRKDNLVQVTFLHKNENKIRKNV